MRQPEIVWRTRRAGGGTVWVRSRRGGWRAITFDSAPTALGKLLGLAGVLDRIGSATTTVVAGVLLVAQVIPSPAVGTSIIPRDGPAASSAVQPCGP